MKPFNLTPISFVFENYVKPKNKVLQLNQKLLMIKENTKIVIL